MCNLTIPSREANMVTLYRDGNGKPTVWCDPCISPLIAALNSSGIKTVASCCGHGERDGSILLRDGRELIIKPPKPTPPGSQESKK